MPSGRSTAHWCFDRLPDSGEQSWLHTHRDLWLRSGQPWHAYLDDWARREHLHSGHATIRALTARFHTRLLAQAPYFFPDLHRTSEADEKAAADSGEIRATGIRYVATKPTDAMAQHVDVPIAYHGHHPLGVLPDLRCHVHPERNARAGSPETA